MPVSRLFLAEDLEEGLLSLKEKLPNMRLLRRFADKMFALES